MNLILTHKNGDFDALAASLAASRLYPGSRIILPDPLQPNLRSFINLYRDLLPLEENPELAAPVDQLIVIDTNRRERLDRWADFLERARRVVVYDHHPGKEDLGADLVRIEQVGATTTILVEEIRKKNLPLTDFEATLFVLGILEDTGCLTYDITTARDTGAVAYLWGYSIGKKMIRDYLHSPLTVSQKDLLEKMIRSSTLYSLNRRRVLVSTTVLDEYVVGASAILQLLDEIEDAGLTVVIVQMNDSIYLAARTRDSDLDLLRLLAPFDVRGYPGSVSAQVRGSTVEAVKKEVLQFLVRHLPPLATAGDIASRPVFTVTADMAVVEADELLADHGYKGCPVIEDGSLAGIISRRDLRKGMRARLGHAPVKGFMTRSLITASPGESLDDLRRLMADKNIGRVPIINHKGDLSGIVTRSDILRHHDYMDRRGRFLEAKKQDYAPPVKEPDRKKIHQPGERADNMSALLENELPGRMQKILRLVSREADTMNLKVYLVGGIIRDLLLRRPPSKDLDFVVIGDALAFASRLHELLGGSLKQFDKFGTASLLLGDGLRLDLVTARREFYASPASLPDVESSSLKNDLYRRDFTINTMACALSIEGYGRFYDYYNGEKDLQNALIRVLYKLSFVDDPLRILRAVRFEKRYSFNIERETLTLMQRAIGRGLVNRVSRQRLNHELKLFYSEESPAGILKHSDELGLLPQLYPGLSAKEETWKLLFRLEKVLPGLAENDKGIRPDRELTYLAGLLYYLESEERSAIINKLGFSREREVVITEVCAKLPGILNKLEADDLKHSAVAGTLRSLPAEGLTLAAALAENKTVRSYLELYMKNLRFLRPRIGGGDLKKLGLEPGPLYQEIIEKLKEAVIDGEVRTPREELDYVIAYLEKRNR